LEKLRFLSVRENSCRLPKAKYDKEAVANVIKEIKKICFKN
jgi:hypothetical protein